MFKRIFKNDKLTLEKIMDCIRKEGYYPQRLNNEHVVFKIQGEPIDVYYYADKQYFELQKRYFISDEQQMSAVEKAAFYTMTEIQLIKIYTHMVEETNWLVFSVECYMSSFPEFETFFPGYMCVLFQSLDYHRQYCKKILEGQPEDDVPRPKIGFPTSSSNVKS